MKIHEADQFKQLHDCCMVFQEILKEQLTNTDSQQVQLHGAGG